MSLPYGHVVFALLATISLFCLHVNQRLTSNSLLILALKASLNGAGMALVFGRAFDIAKQVRFCGDLEF